MTEEKEKPAPAPRSWWQELFDHIREAKPDARYTADEPPPVVAPEPLPPEPEPEGEPVCHDFSHATAKEQTNDPTLRRLP